MNDERRQRVVLAIGNGSQMTNFAVFLASKRLSVTPCRRPEEVLAAVEEEPADLLVLDAELQEGAAYELCRHLRAATRHRDVPLLLLSSRSDPASLGRALVAGATKLLVGPLDPNQLLLQIHSLLGAGHHVPPHRAAGVALDGLSREAIFDFLSATLEEHALLAGKEATDLRRRAQQQHATATQLGEKTLELSAAKRKMERMQRELMNLSRRDGMAEVASDVLHNVGNMLNSVKVSMSIIASGLERSHFDMLARLAQVLRQHEDDMESFLTTSGEGRQFPRFICLLNDALQETRQELVAEVEAQRALLEKVELFIRTQQKQAQRGERDGLTEPIDLVSLLDDALLMSEVSRRNLDVELRREFRGTPQVTSNRPRLYSVLLNLLSNALDALRDGRKESRVLTLRASTLADGDAAVIEVEDNGIGISSENLIKIFSQGFTTKQGGHGYGLHSSALAIQELGGRMTVRSDGEGRGAVFTVELPVHAPPRSKAAERGG